MNIKHTRCFFSRILLSFVWFFVWLISITYMSIAKANTVKTDNADLILITKEYNKQLSDCKKKFSSAQCQRQATLNYTAKKNSIKQDNILNNQAKRILNTKNKSTKQVLISKKYGKIPILNKNRPTLLSKQGTFTHNTFYLKNNRLLKTIHINKEKNTILIAPIINKPIINLMKRQKETEKKRLNRLDKNNKRREKGFIVDKIEIPV